MDKEKATRILSRELGDKLERIAVLESSYKDSLIKNASAVYQLDSPVLINSKDRSIKNYGYGSFADANYYFLESVHALSNKYSDSWSRFAVTPYALIGEKEKTSLRKLFYKNVHPEIAYAMSTLRINNFIEFYKHYKDSSFDYPTISPTLTVLKEDLEVMNKFINFATKLKYDDDEEVHKRMFAQFGGIGSLNAILDRRIGTTIKPSRAHPERYIHREDISSVVKQLLEFIDSVKDIKKHNNSLLNEFVYFVFFSLPYEEQNAESNKKILKNSSNPDFIAAVLSKEYSEGKYFQEYFDVLNEEVRGQVVCALKSCPNKKPVYDSFLWSKGFKDTTLDYIDIYKKDANTFIQYFNKRSLEEKKTILKDIINCDFVNEEVADWLNQNESDLLREVGFNG